jgi:hypothetical protein
LTSGVCIGTGVGSNISSFLTRSGLEQEDKTVPKKKNKIISTDKFNLFITGKVGLPDVLIYCNTKRDIFFSVNFPPVP